MTRLLGSFVEMESGLALMRVERKGPYYQSRKTLRMAVEKHQFLGVEVVVASERMARLLGEARKLAEKKGPLLVVGEAGTGKEIVGRALHHYSSRRERAFVDLHCAGLPEELVEAELFGHEKGAFSGAKAAKPGLLELAAGGSLYLDDFEALSERLRGKLLRAVEQGQMHRIGAVKAVKVDVRLIAASGVRMEWRGDVIEAPPLRERAEDIEPLAQFFLAQQNPELKLASDAMIALYSYQWPGNVRELRNTVLRSAMSAKGPLLHADDILFQVKPVVADRGLEGMEAAMIRLALEEAGGHRQRAASALGITRQALSRKMKAYGLEAQGKSSW